MPDWIKVRAKEVRLAEEVRKTERDRQANAATALKAKTEPFWSELVAVLQDSVAEFNAEFPETDRRIDQFEKPSAAGVTIKRTVYPAAAVKAQLNSGATAVSYTISRTHRKGAEPVERQGNLALGVTEGEAAYMDDGIGQHEDVAKIFLDPFFQF